MGEYVEHEETLAHGFTIEIVHDDDCWHGNPRENDNLGHIVSWSRNYTIGEEQPSGGVGIWLYAFAIEMGLPHWQIAWLYREPQETVADLNELADYDLEGRIEDKPSAILANIRQKCLIIGLNIGAYQHGDLTYCDAVYAASQSRETGFIYVTHERITKEYGEVTPDMIERATLCLRGEVEEYSDWATGNVHGYRVLAPATLDDDGEEEEDREEVEAVWGFIGDYDGYVLDEARSSARYAINAWVKDKPGIPLPRELALAVLQ